MTLPNTLLWVLQLQAILRGARIPYQRLLHVHQDRDNAHQMAKKVVRGAKDQTWIRTTGLDQSSHAKRENDAKCIVVTRPAWRALAQADKRVFHLESCAFEALHL